MKIKRDLVAAILTSIFMLISGYFLQSAFEVFFPNPITRFIFLVSIYLIVGVVAGIVYWTSYQRSKRYEKEGHARNSQDTLENRVFDVSLVLFEEALNQMDCLSQTNEWLTDNQAKEEERNARNRVWIYTKSLEPDLTTFLHIITDNLKAGKSYQYVYPTREKINYEKLVQQCVTASSDVIKNGRLNGFSAIEEGIPVQLVILDADYEMDRHKRVFLHFPKMSRDRKTIEIKDENLINQFGNYFKTLWSSLLLRAGVKK